MISENGRYESKENPEPHHISRKMAESNPGYHEESQKSKKYSRKSLRTTIRPRKQQRFTSKALKGEIQTYYKETQSAGIQSIVQNQSEMNNFPSAHGAVSLRTRRIFDLSTKFHKEDKLAAACHENSSAIQTFRKYGIILNPWEFFCNCPSGHRMVEMYKKDAVDGLAMFCAKRSSCPKFSITYDSIFEGIKHPLIIILRIIVRLYDSGWSIRKTAENLKVSVRFVKMVKVYTCYLVYESKKNGRIGRKLGKNQKEEGEASISSSETSEEDKREENKESQAVEKAKEEREGQESTSQKETHENTESKEEKEGKSENDWPKEPDSDASETDCYPQNQDNPKQKGLLGGKRDSQKASLISPTEEFPPSKISSEALDVQSQGKALNNPSQTTSISKILENFSSMSKSQEETNFCRCNLGRSMLNHPHHHQPFRPSFILSYGAIRRSGGTVEVCQEFLTTCGKDPQISVFATCLFDQKTKEKRVFVTGSKLSKEQLQKTIENNVKNPEKNVIVFESGKSKNIERVFEQLRRSSWNFEGGFATKEIFKIQLEAEYNLWRMENSKENLAKEVLKLWGSSNYLLKDTKMILHFAKEEFNTVKPYD